MLRFSLWTLLIAVTALVVMLGAEVNRMHRRNAAITSLEKVGQVVFHHQYPYSYGTVGVTADYTAEVHGPSWLRRLVGDEWFLKVQGIHIQGDDYLIDDATRLPEVRLLSISGSNVTNKGLSSLPKLRKLEMLTLVDAHITTIKPFKHMDWLKQLDLINTKLTKDQVCELKVALPSTLVVHENHRSNVAN